MSCVRVSRAALIAAAALVVGACERGEQPVAAGGQTVSADAAPDEAMQWAREALGRNPHIELMASDAQANVFTVRDKRTGDVQVIKLNELAAAPVAQLQASGREAAAGPTQSSAPQPETAAPAQAPTSDATSSSVEQPSAAATGSAEPAQQSGEPGYIIERTEGGLRVSGPGVSIVSAGGGAGAAGSQPARRADERIICEGRRMVHFDNRDIFVEGDAITVRDGCEMFITNSRIAATGTAVTVHDATVHFSNSYIEGADGSFDAGPNAKLYVRGSTFEGVSRRDEQAQVQDQGGNRWR